MINEKLAKIEIKTGLSAVCAWCEHYHNGKKEGKVCCGKKECGLLYGFIKYKGPMESRLASFCFICGKNSESVIEIKGRMVGICHGMGPNKETCFDKFRSILHGNQKGVIVNEIVVPIGKKDDSER